MNTRLLLHLEGAAVLVLSLLCYHWSHGNWIQFAALFLVPDVSMVGYLAGARTGAATYNAVHTYVGPLLLACYAIGMAQHTTLLLALVWIAHIGFDRMLGFGLKYPDSFKDTHLAAERHMVPASPNAA
jgi:Domain of unknown function (DUF4260)